MVVLAFKVGTDGLYSAEFCVSWRTAVGLKIGGWWTSWLIELGKSYVSSQVKKRLEAEMLVRPTRLHSMENVHTPDLQGFLGFPKPTKFTKGEMERTWQVGRLGAQLTRMLSKTNYMESRNGTRIIEHDETEAGTSSQGPSTTSTLLSSIEALRTQWVDAVASLMPSPSPPEEVPLWPPNSLGSFIPIKLPRKQMPSERQQANPEEVPLWPLSSLGSFIPIKLPQKRMPSERQQANVSTTYSFESQFH